MIHSSSNEFPKSVEGFGYRFNEEGKLRNIKTNERFEFYVKRDDHSYNQKHYEALGEVIGEHIENELVSEYGLLRRVIPVELEEDEDALKSRIYLRQARKKMKEVASCALDNGRDKLGTMYPYIRKAQELKWGIVIFNPNENYGRIIRDGKVVSRGSIKGSESSDNHCLYVWKNFVRTSKAEKIMIVAHSYGGINTTYLLSKLADEFKSRVIAIALTDSVHSVSMIPTQLREWFMNHSLNWIKSSLPLSENIKEAKKFYGCRCFSAGHPKHEYTSGTAFEDVFEFLTYRLKKSYDDQKKDQDNQDNQDTSKDSDQNDMEIDKENDKESIKQDTGGTSSVSTSTDAPTEMEIDDDSAATKNNDKPVENEKDDREAINDNSTDLSKTIVVDPDTANDISDPSDGKVLTEGNKQDPEATKDTSTFANLNSENIDSTENSAMENGVSTSVDSDQVVNVSKSLNSELEVTQPSPEILDGNNQQGTNVIEDESSHEQSQNDNTEILQHLNDDQNTKVDANEMDTDNGRIQGKEPTSIADQEINQSEEEGISNPSKE
ncbi:7461_t:CDS:2 [Acaulospora morrowiae]|uniref:7461_t:CDS:1 n=1 Tax=Acaulospora morrowiae TaxID=94023 RepID=A0A9N9EBF1_9GLOM|nr:7461_t:CDS:2 [Acaulospora morrowiae]